MKYLITVVLLSCSLLASAQNKTSEFPKIDPTHITIARDSFGTPHIFAKTDAEVAYGLAWANAEDAFGETQDLIYTVKGYMGRKKGIEGAKIDFFVHAIGAKKIVDERYDKDLTPEFRKYLNGFVQGLNAYAAAHPDEVKIRRAFPVTEKDVLAEYVTIMSFLIGVQNSVGDIVGGKYDSVPVDLKHRMPPVGSNAYAANGNKTVDGKTYLCINPHLAMDGALSFYECHLSSDEGLDFIGNMFQGSTSNAMGTNKHLGWAFTWNYFDQLDVYKMEMDPKHKLSYILDGKSEKLEKRPTWLKVNWHGIVIPVRKMAYWSKYGMTLKSDKSDNFFAVRFPSNQTIKAGQELYAMAKSQNYEQFWQAMRSNHAIALFNMVYADDKNNIFYVSHGTMPDRKHQEYNWGGIIPGNTSETLWTDLVPMDSMPHVINPQCGYVFNTNNNVFDATCEGQNDNPKRLPLYVNQRPGNNNRAETLKEFFKTHDRVNFDDFRRVKFEGKLNANSIFWKSLTPLWQLDKAKYPDLSNYITSVQTWDRSTDTASTGTTCFGCFLNQVWDKKHYDDEQFAMGFPLSESETVQYLRDAQQYMMTNFGSLDVKWGSVHKLRRGDKVLSIGSFADMLSPSYPKPHTYNGKLEFNPEYGDTYTMFVKYGKDGAEFVESLQPLGNSITPGNKHYNDQMEIFVQHKMKHQTFDRGYWLKHYESLYRPSFK
jgi:acyl-homoserine-lactone acylase